MKQSLSAIDKEELLDSFADELKLDLELSEKIKEKISSHDPLDECQREVQAQKLEEIRKRRDGLENEKQLLKRVQNKETSLIPMVGIEDSSEEIARQILIIRQVSRKISIFLQNLQHIYQNLQKISKFEKIPKLQ